MSRVSLDRIDWVDLKQDRLKLVFRGKEDELMQSIVEIENDEQRVFALRLFGAILSVTKALRADGVEQVQPPCEASAQE